MIDRLSMKFAGRDPVRVRGRLLLLRFADISGMNLIIFGMNMTVCLRKNDSLCKVV